MIVAADGDGEYDIPLPVLPGSETDYDDLFYLFYDPPFIDVDLGDWYWDAAMFNWAWGFMLGTGDNLFSPDVSLNRAMIVTILHRIFAAPDADEFDNPFPDVPDGEWFTDAVKWMVSMDLVLGYEDGTFRPYRPVTKEELAVFIYRILNETGLISSLTGYGTEYLDMDEVSDWAAEAVGYLNDISIFIEIPGEYFNPETPATRAEVASMIYRYYIAVIYDDINYPFMFEEDMLYVIHNLCEETINLIDEGLEARFTNDYAVICDEICWIVIISTFEDGADWIIYAVGQDSKFVYRYDFDEDDWVALVMG